MKNEIRLQTDQDLDAFCRLRRKVVPIIVTFIVALVFAIFPGYAMLHIMAPREQQPHFLWPLYNMGGWMVFCFVVFSVLITLLRQLPTVKKVMGVPRFTRDAIGNFQWAEKAYAIWKTKGSKHQLKKSYTCIHRIERFYSPLYEIPKVKALRESILKDMEKIG
jgi:hypothetical protein